MSKYLVKLTPTGKFFFGGDMRFGINGEKEKFTSYIIESLKMPQQTSLLGMMRFLLLSNSKYFNNATNTISGNKSDVDNLIGERSFSVTDGKSVNTFGAIKNLGPCFIYCKNDKKRYFREPKEEQFTLIDFGAATTAIINGKEVQLPEIKLKDDNGHEKLYTGKEYLKPYFAPLPSTDEMRIEEDDLFIEDRRIGIDKDYEGKSNNNTLYKQISYRLEEGYCFAFEVETEHDLTAYNNQTVSLGADSSIFIFEAEIARDTSTYDSRKQGTTVVLLSDAYIPDIPAEAQYSFSINSMRTFRFLETVNTEDASYYRINGKKTPAASKRYELYEAGSTFYFKDEATRDKFCEILEERKDFNQIGYNKYYIK